MLVKSVIDDEKERERLRIIHICQKVDWTVILWQLFFKIRSLNFSKFSKIKLNSSAVLCQCVNCFYCFLLCTSVQTNILIDSCFYFVLMILMFFCVEILCGVNQSCHFIIFIYMDVLTLSPPIPLRLYTLSYWSNPPF